MQFFNQPKILIKKKKKKRKENSQLENIVQLQ